MSRYLGKAVCPMAERSGEHSPVFVQLSCGVKVRSPVTGAILEGGTAETIQFQP